MARRYSRRELEQRNHLRNAAIVIDNVVYDVTRFLEDHPGGAEILLDNAGKDASKCFHDVGHSDDARLWRKEFAIGEVVEEDKWEVFGGRESAAEDDAPPTARALVGALAPPLLLGLAWLLYVCVL